MSVKPQSSSEELIGMWALRRVTVPSLPGTVPVLADPQGQVPEFHCYRNEH